MTPIDSHLRPTPDRGVQKRQKTKEEPKQDFSGLFFSILDTDEPSKKPYEIAEEFLLCDLELVSTISSMEDFPKVGQEFIQFLRGQNVDHQKGLRCCKILDAIYRNALNAGPMRQELVKVIREFNDLEILASEENLKGLHRNLRTASPSRKIHILSEINQLKPFLDASRNAKLLCLAQLLVSTKEVEEDFPERLKVFFAEVKEAEQWILSASEYCPPLSAGKGMEIEEPSPLGELSDFALPLLEGLGEILAAKRRCKTANEAFEEIFRDVEDFEWMDLLKMVLDQYPLESRQEFCEKLYPHRHTILETMGMDESIQGMVQSAEKAAIVKICKEAFKDLQISVNRNSVSISWRVSPP